MFNALKLETFVSDALNVYGLSSGKSFDHQVDQASLTGWGNIKQHSSLCISAGPQRIKQQ